MGKIIDRVRRRETNASELVRYRLSIEAFCEEQRKASKQLEAYHAAVEKYGLSRVRFVGGFGSLEFVITDSAPNIGLEQTKPVRPWWRFW